MSTLIRTDEVPAADRLDFVQEITAATWVPMECRSEHRADYWGEFRASGLGPMQVVVLDIMPITVRRTPALISQADPDMLKIFLVCGGGSSLVDQGGRQARLSAAEFAFYDTRRPYEVACGVGQDRPTRVHDLHVPAVPVAAAAQPAQTADRHAHPGHHRAGRSDVAVPSSAGP